MIYTSAHMDIQLFADEKTEKATPKRRQDARKKGQVVRSMELNSAATILAMFAALKALAPYMVDKLEKVYNKFLYIEEPIDSFFTPKGLYEVFLSTMIYVVTIILPILGVALIVGIVINYAQVGVVFTENPLKPDFSRINPIQGFKRIFSKRSLMELLKSIIKLALIGSISYKEISSKWSYINEIPKTDIFSGAKAIGDLGIDIGLKCGAALAGLAIFDYFFQWREYEKSIMMTKQEIKEEYKQTEGDPLVKSKIKEKQRQISMRRMMQDMLDADVIITNPTHYAVAIKYDPKAGDAPIVLAKGQDYVALKIKDVARENDITIVENKPLAQALYKSTDIGQSIPPELFRAVAEVLAFVYNLKGKNVF
nr:flagellar biosynthesis protein FlhB [Xylanivirga thermophila]